MSPSAASFGTEYLSVERKSPIKHELRGGRVVAMAAASKEHVVLVTALTMLVGTSLRGRPCAPFNSDLRVHVPQSSIYTYPDLTVVCGEPKFLDDGHLDTLTNPTALFEVLSPSTEAYDRGEKFLHYRLIPELQLYVLVATATPRVEVLVRQPNGSWNLTVFEGLDAKADLGPIGVTLSLAELYERIQFAD